MDEIGILFNYTKFLWKPLKSKTLEPYYQLHVVSTNYRNNQLYLRARADEASYIKARVNKLSSVPKF